MMDFKFLFPGKLYENRAEAALYKTLRSMYSSTLMHQLFDSKQDTYQEWSKEDWICFNCLLSFFRDTLPIWWLDKKRKG